MLCMSLANAAQAGFWHDAGDALDPHKNGTAEAVEDTADEINDRVLTPTCTLDWDDNAGIYNNCGDDTNGQHQ